MKIAYLCDIEKNAACTKEWCKKNGGPCGATTDPACAFRDVHGQPILVDEDDMREAAARYFKKGRDIHDN